MSQHPYTRRLIGAHNATASSYVVPAGKRVVILDVEVVVTVAGTVNMALTVAGVLVVYAAVKQSSSTVQWGNWQGRAVAYAGETITVSCTQAADLTATGYEFNDP